MSKDHKAQRLIRKIRALRAKKVEAGATEGEAAAAAELAAKLMAEHRIDEADVAAADYDRSYIAVKGVGLHINKSHPMVYAAPGVSHLTGCEIYTRKGGFYVVGDDVGREMAHYLFDMIRNCIDAAWAIERASRRAVCADYWRRAFYQPMPAKIDSAMSDMFRECGAAFDRVAQRSFGLGMATRISDRMEAMQPARRVPDEVATRIMSDKDAKKPSKSSARHDSSAIGAGLTAGKSVPISMGVNSGGKSAAPAQIASKPPGVTGDQP